jgi:hypothetical protein
MHRFAAGGSAATCSASRVPGSTSSFHRETQTPARPASDLDLQIGPRRLAFTSETFILSFSLPNFHFHAVTAYDILRSRVRSRGVPLGKRDYEGRLRTRSA